MDGPVAQCGKTPHEGQVIIADVRAQNGCNYKLCCVEHAQQEATPTKLSLVQLHDNLVCVACLDKECIGIQYQFYFNG